MAPTIIGAGWAKGRKEGHTAGADTSHRVALDPVAAVADGGTVVAKVQGWTAVVTAANNQNQHI